MFNAILRHNRHRQEFARDHYTRKPYTINVNALEQQVSIAEVAFDNVRVSGLFDKSGLDLQRLFTPKSPAADATPANANPSAAHIGNSTAHTSNSTAQKGNSETEDEDVSNVATDNTEELAHDTSWYVELHQFAFNDGSTIFRA